MWTAAHIPRGYRSIRLAGSLGTVIAAFLAGFLWPSHCQAQPCTALPNPIIVSVPPAAEPFIQKVAFLLQRTKTPNPMPATVAWQVNPSCAGVDVVANDKSASCVDGGCLHGQAKFYPVADDPIAFCDLDAGATTGTKANLVLSEVAPATCLNYAGNPPAGVLDSGAAGPVIPYALVMSQQAPQSANSIQAEEAHFVFSVGGPAQVPPWLKSATVFLFGNKDAAELLLGPRVKLASDRWKGTIVSTADDLLAGLKSDAATALGILATPFADTRRSDFRILAFQALSQHGAFFPDRKSNSFDKQNVRDGHYPLWGFLHMIQRESPTAPGQPKYSKGNQLATMLLGNAPAAGQDVVDLQVAAGFVPKCAMRVTRQSDAGPPAATAPADACNCWFEQKVKQPGEPLGCKECPDGVCAEGTCRRKLCEVP